ncbi:MAG: ribosomal protein S18-alanine N-acetyltransferase [Ruthenibacterium sp.]
MIFKKLEPQEAAAVAAIEAQVADGWSENGILSALESAAVRCFIAKENDVVLAFCCFSLVAEEANLDALSVAAAARRRGVGTALLTFTFAALAAEDAQKIFLEVRSKNAAAIALYRKLGFAAIGTRRNFYANPADDAVIMEKNL